MKIFSLALLALLLIGCQSENGLLDPFEAGWKGQKVCTIKAENESYRLLECTFPPGVGHEKHEHQPHVGYTVKGSKFRIEDDEGIREVDVPNGYAFEHEINTIHEVQNVGQDTAVFLIYEYK